MFRDKQVTFPQKYRWQLSHKVLSLAGGWPLYYSLFLRKQCQFGCTAEFEVKVYLKCQYKLNTFHMTLLKVTLMD